MGKLERIIKDSPKIVGRLLHYFPVENSKVEKDLNWCGWHNDHGTLTGLVSAMYIDKNGNEVDP